MRDTMDLLVTFAVGAAVCGTIAAFGWALVESGYLRVAVCAFAVGVCVFAVGVIVRDTIDDDWD